MKDMDDQVNAFIKLLLNTGFTESDLEGFISQIEEQDVDSNEVPETEIQAIKLLSQFDESLDNRTLDKIYRKFYFSLAVAKLVARHPSCEKNLLRRLYHYMQDDVLANTKLPEYEKEQNWQRNLGRAPAGIRPDRWSSNPMGVLPYRYWVNHWMQHGANADKRYLAGIDLMYPEVLLQLAQDKSSTIRKALAERRELDVTLAEILVKDKAKTVREALAKNPKVPAEILKILAADTEEIVSIAALQHENCPREAQREARMRVAAEPSLADQTLENYSQKDLITLLADKSTRSDTLEKLARHPDAWVRAAVALHVNTGSDVLAELAKDKEEFVQDSVAFNTQTPVHALTQLYTKASVTRRRALASNKNLPENLQLEIVENGPEVLREVLVDCTESVNVMQALLESGPDKGKKKKNGWRDTLGVLLNPASKNLFKYSQGPKSKKLFVAKLLAAHPNCTDGLKKHYAFYCYDALLKNPSIALALLENPNAIRAMPFKDWKVNQWLAEGKAPGVVSNFYLQSDDIKRRRQAVDSPSALERNIQSQVFIDDIHLKKRLAMRTDSSRFMLEVLARDEKAPIRELVAKNAACPPEIIALLSEDKNSAVKIAAKQHRNFKAPTASIDAGSTKEKKEKKEKPVSEQLHNKGQKRDRIRIAKEAKRISILADLMHDRAWEVRKEAAGNSACTAEILEKLAGDEDSNVRISAAGNKKISEEKLLEMVTDVDGEVREVVLKSLTARRNIYKNDTWYYDESIFALFYEDTHERIQMYLARLSSNIDYQNRVLARADENCLRNLASNSNLHQSVALKMINASERVCDTLIRKTQNKDVFFKLIDTHLKYQEKTDYSYNLLNDEEVQQWLSCHKSSTVRASTAKWINNKKYLNQLIADDEVVVREAAASSYYLEKAQIKSLLAKANSTILHALWSNHKEYLEKSLPKYYPNLDVPLRVYLAGTYHPGEDLFSLMRMDEEDEVRIKLAKNFTIDKETYELLEKDRCEAVRNEIQKNNQARYLIEYGQS